VALPGAHRSADFTVDLEHGDLAAQLALIAGLAAKQKPGL
jgi:hypothetical protein